MSDDNEDVKDDSTLWTAILAVMDEVGYVHKSGKVKGYGMNYSFAGEADLLRVLRPAMVRHGLGMLPVGMTRTEIHEMLPSKNGERPSRTVRVSGTYRLFHRSGEFVDLQADGEGQDSGDKATAKAMTIALKYALRQAFLIETGDDPDRERPEEDDRNDHRSERPRGGDGRPQNGPPPIIREAKRLLRSQFGNDVNDAESFTRDTVSMPLARALSDAKACETLVVALNRMEAKGR